MRDAKAARAGSFSAAGRFEGLEPVPQTCDTDAGTFNHGVIN